MIFEILMFLDEESKISKYYLQKFSNFTHIFFFSVEETRTEQREYRPK